jgi:Na+/phosphate symporter
MDARKLPSVSLTMTIFGALLFLPPLVLLFNGPVRWFGIPAEVLYLFVVWFGLVLGTALLSRRLPRAPSPAEDGEGEP